MAVESASSLNGKGRPRLFWLEGTWKVVSIILAVISIIALSWQFLRRKALTCEYAEESLLISLGEAPLNEVKSEFRGERLSSLHKLDFVLANTGGLPIRKEDVVEPITLAFPAGSHLLAAAVNRTVPEFSASASIDQNSPFASLKFDLLNPGDRVFFSVYLYNSQDRKPRVLGRVVDMREVRFIDSRTEAKHGPAAASEFFWFAVVFLAFILCVLLGSGISHFAKFRAHARWTTQKEAREADCKKRFAAAETDTARQMIVAEMVQIGSPPAAAYTDWGGAVAFNLVYLLFFMLCLASLYYVVSTRGWL